MYLVGFSCFAGGIVLGFLIGRQYRSLNIDECIVETFQIGIPSKTPKIQVTNYETRLAETHQGQIRSRLGQHLLTDSPVRD